MMETRKLRDNDRFRLGGQRERGEKRVSKGRSRAVFSGDIHTSKKQFHIRDLSCCEAWRAVVLLQEKRAMADAATSQDAGPDTPALGAPEEPPMTPHFGATSSSALAAGAGGVVLSETQLGSMALRAKQQRTKAEQDKQLLQVRPYATHWAPPARSLGTLPASKWCSLSRAGAE